MTRDTATITLTGPDNLIAHVEALQATLTKRNDMIASLQVQLDTALNGDLTDEQTRRAYERGWKACASRLEQIAREGALALSEIRRGALDIYYEGTNAP